MNDTKIQKNLKERKFNNTIKTQDKKTGESGH